jgi:hypothetical protein
LPYGQCVTEPTTNDIFAGSPLELILQMNWTLLSSVSEHLARTFYERISCLQVYIEGLWEIKLLFKIFQDFSFPQQGKCTVSISDPADLYLKISSLFSSL